MGQFTQLYLSPLRQTIELGGYRGGRGGSHGQAPTRGGSRGGSGCGGAEYDSGMGSTNYGKRYKQDDSSRCSHPGAPNVTPR